MKYQIDNEYFVRIAPRIELFNEYYSELDDEYKDPLFRSNSSFDQATPWEITMYDLGLLYVYLKFDWEYYLRRWNSSQIMKNVENKYGALISRILFENGHVVKSRYYHPNNMSIFEFNKRFPTDTILKIDLPEPLVLSEKVLDLFDTIIINKRD